MNKGEFACTYCISRFYSKINDLECLPMPDKFVVEGGKYVYNVKQIKYVDNESILISVGPYFRKYEIVRSGKSKCSGFTYEQMLAFFILEK
jgi:hypothetical protein